MPLYPTAVSYKFAVTVSNPLDKVNLPVMGGVECSGESITVAGNSDGPTITRKPFTIEITEQPVT